MFESVSFVAECPPNTKDATKQHPLLKSAIYPMECKTILLGSDNPGPPSSLARGQGAGCQNLAEVGHDGVARVHEAHLAIYAAGALLIDLQGSSGTEANTDTNTNTCTYADSDTDHLMRVLGI